MSKTIDNAFAKHFGAEVHEAYQRMGSKLRKTVRVRSNVVGTETTFHTIGYGAAQTKGRNADIPVMNLSHDKVTCKLEDYYAGEWIDKLDALKISYDERQAVVNAAAYALGRKTDELIINAANAAVASKAGDDVTTISTALTKTKILKALEKLGTNNVPDDGQRYAVVGWKQWSQLLDIDEFKDSRYVGQEELPWLGTQVKMWLGTYWMPHSGLTKNSSKNRICFWYHKTAIGHAVASEVETDITWNGSRAAYFVNSSMSQGAKVVDPNGIEPLICRET